MTNNVSAISVYLFMTNVFLFIYIPTWKYFFNYKNYNKHCLYEVHLFISVLQEQWKSAESDGVSRFRMHTHWNHLPPKEA